MHKGILPRLALHERGQVGYKFVSYYLLFGLINFDRICGRVGSVPTYQWYVDEQNPEDVTIIMKNIGLNDGHSEGISFTLSGA